MVDFREVQIIEKYKDIIQNLRLSHLHKFQVIENQYLGDLKRNNTILEQTKAQLFREKKQAVINQLKYQDELCQKNDKIKELESLLLKEKRQSALIKPLNEACERMSSTIDELRDLLWKERANKDKGVCKAQEQNRIQASIDHLRQWKGPAEKKSADSRFVRFNELNIAAGCHYINTRKPTHTLTYKILERKNPINQLAGGTFTCTNHSQKVVWNSAQIIIQLHFTNDYEFCVKVLNQQCEKCRCYTAPKLDHAIYLRRVAGCLERAFELGKQTEMITMSNIPVTVNQEDIPIAKKLTQEALLHQRLKDGEIESIIGCKAKLVAENWQVTPGYPQNGEGDLVFLCKSGVYHVVEVKWINYSNGIAVGGSAKKINKVKMQAQTYGRAWKIRVRKFKVRCYAVINNTDNQFTTVDSHLIK
ncbi:hypothetical protein HK103_002617 [Boothiomyces macroporosus]|uniref:3CxxC-type domain-containing protein n=1 Tax=Boothiomyces macroporosus TaxID=261099 RepID=A0AAD5Y4A2_9FUNG|nr:hypothetical protein HK103_002617 [Boothiomyces macroporosus]